MRAHDHLILFDLVPDPDKVRRRLAILLTEADVLRSQLRISLRLARERERLRLHCGVTSPREEVTPEE